MRPLVMSFEATAVTLTGLADWLVVSLTQLWSISSDLCLLALPIGRVTVMSDGNGNSGLTQTNVWELCKHNKNPNLKANANKKNLNNNYK